MNSSTSSNSTPSSSESIKDIRHDKITTANTGNVTETSAPRLEQRPSLAGRPLYNHGRKEGASRGYTKKVVGLKFS